MFPKDINENEFILSFNPISKTPFAHRTPLSDRDRNYALIAGIATSRSRLRNSTPHLNSLFDNRLHLFKEFEGLCAENIGSDEN
jgi:hypothetical protein